MYFISEFVCMHLCICVYMCVRVCTCVYLCVVQCVHTCTIIRNLIIFTDENAITYDENNNNSTSLVKPEPTLPDFSQDIVKVRSTSNCVL